MTRDPSGLAIGIRNTRGCSVLRLRGELDLLTAPELTAALEEAVSTGAMRVVVDLDEVTFVDSSGINALLVGEKRLARSGGSLVLAAPTDATRRVLEIANVTRLIATADSVEAAMSGAREHGEADATG